MKGLIPAAGMGTRLKPYTNAIPKELLPVGDKAVIEHVIEAFRQADITDITIVVGWKKNAILDYLGSGQRLGVHLTYVVQDERLGLANAIYAGRHVICDSTFAVINGDNFFSPITFLRELKEFHQQQGADVTLGVADIHDTTRHGIIAYHGIHVIDIIEKPQPQDAPSMKGAAGIYIMSAGIFDAIDQIQPGVHNEYQLADAFKLMIDRDRKVIFKDIPGFHIDVGTPEDFRKANRLYYQNEEMGHTYNNVKGS
jgi:dTDP-glucose pyrophosphorylase